MSSLSKSDRDIVIVNTTDAEQRSLSRWTKDFLEAYVKYTTSVENLIRRGGLTVSGMSSGDIARSGLLLHGDLTGTSNDVREAIKGLR